MAVETASRPQAAASEELKAWAGLAAANDASDFCTHWLTIQCHSIPGVAAGLIVSADENGSLSRVATWPSGTHDVTVLEEAAEQALRDGRSVVVRTPSGEAQLAHPIAARGRMWSAVAVKMGTCSDVELGRAMRALHWGSGWLETVSHRRAIEHDAQAISQHDEILDIVRVSATNEGASDSALALTNMLATRLNCRRAAVGIAIDGKIKVLGLSHSAVLDRRSRTAVSIANAMEEALDQSSTVSYPALPAHARKISIAHRELAREDGFGSLLSVVMMWERQAIGVITLARDDTTPFDPGTVELCEKVAGVLGPIMELQVALDRPLAGRIPQTLTSYRQKLTDDRYHGTKVITAIVVLALAFFLLVPFDYRVTAKSTLEGIVQQAAVAPFDGFVLTAPSRAGDVVEAGQVLATLDTRELALEEIRYEGLRDQAQVRQQEALAKGDRASAAVGAAEAKAAEAQRLLASGKVERAQITAPFAGLVVSGDLSQSLGSPVERGKVLFEIAPLDSYRVNLAVNERDLAHVATGQKGQLVLTGFASDAINFTVSKIVPVATPANGENTFRIEATLDRADPRWRPGMEGVGKIEAGRHSLAWIWMHSIVDWFRLALWKWLP